ncbi:hypothetical protein PTKIN_Ptkin14bG0136000 [Pterospermum kingtungense]
MINRSTALLSGGISENALETVEAIDDRNKSITFDKSEGEVAKYYKTLQATVCVTANDEGSFVKWSLTYEKPNQNVPDPKRYLEFVASLTKSVDAYLLKH